jgi:hypothetical protein
MTDHAKRRVLTSLQSTGRIGQSTLKQGLISWFGWAGIKFSAIDADASHRTLSSWYPEHSTCLLYQSEEDLLPILNVTTEEPVHLIDFPSQHTESLLKAFDNFNALNLFH